MFRKNHLARFIKDEAAKRDPYLTKKAIRNLVRTKKPQPHPVLRLLPPVPTGRELELELMKAVEGRDLNKIRSCLSKGVDVNAKHYDDDDFEFSALFRASLDGNEDVIKELVSKGASINEKVGGGRSALLSVCWKGHADAARFLIERGADVNISDIYETTPLMEAAKHGHLEIVRLLVDADAEVNSADLWGGTPLIKASMNGHYRIVKLLLDNGADIEQGDKGSCNALIDACKNGHLEVARLLIARGADLEASDYYGRTPLMHAISSGKKETAKFLLDCGANVNRRGGGWTAMDYAAANNDGGMALLLQRYGGKKGAGL